MQNKRHVVANSLGLVVASLEEREESTDIKGCSSQTVGTANGRKWVKMCSVYTAKKQKL